MSECHKVRAKKVISKRALQSIVGKLLYIHKCVKPARIFVNRILALLRENFDKKQIKLTTSFYRDIDWFLAFLPKFNGVTYMSPLIGPEHDHLYLDACLTGLGGLWRDRVYASHLQIMAGEHLNITQLEMLNIVIALRCWGPRMAHRQITFNCDNKAVVQVVSGGKTKDLYLAQCIRNIWLLTATYDINLSIEHILSKQNIQADTLSRIYSHTPINQDVYLDLRLNYNWDQVIPEFFYLNLHL